MPWQAMDQGTTRRVRYDTESGLDVLMEMGCGGELDVLVEPLDASSDLDYVVALATCLERRREGRLATVFAHDGQARSTRHAVWCGDELLHDGLADASLLAAIRDRARDLPPRPASDVRDDGPGPIRSAARTRAAAPRTGGDRQQYDGAGVAAAGQACLGWSTTLVDFDAARLRAASVPEASARCARNRPDLVEAVQPDADTSVIVMTHNLHKDADYLAALRDVPLAYLGLLGARGRVKRVVDLAGARGHGHPWSGRARYRRGKSRRNRPVDHRRNPRRDPPASGWSAARSGRRRCIDRAAPPACR